MNKKIMITMLFSILCIPKVNGMSYFGSVLTGLKATATKVGRSIPKPSLDTLKRMPGLAIDMVQKHPHASIATGAFIGGTTAALFPSSQPQPKRSSSTVDLPIDDGKEEVEKINPETVAKINEFFDTLAQDEPKKSQDLIAAFSDEEKSIVLGVLIEQRQNERCAIQEDFARREMEQLERIRQSEIQRLQEKIEKKEAKVRPIREHVNGQLVTARNARPGNILHIMYRRMIEGDAKIKALQDQLASL